jgi:hypothetical protein
MDTLILTLLFIVVGYGIAFEIARRKAGVVRGIVAYVVGFLGVLVAAAVATLFEPPPGNAGLDFAPLAAVFAPGAGVFAGRCISKRGQWNKSP